MMSAQITAPPSPSKLELIRRFMAAAGIENQIDSGSMISHLMLPGGPVFNAALGEETTFLEAVKAASDALHTVYLKHRSVWQEEYESHINWEFTEAELEEIVGFLEKPVGQHFLEGSRRMDAYIGTNTEALMEEIGREAESALLSR
jgi:hypothetical protein